MEERRLPDEADERDGRTIGPFGYEWCPPVPTGMAPGRRHSPSRKISWCVSLQTYVPCWASFPFPCNTVGIVAVRSLCWERVVGEEYVG